MAGSTSGKRLALLAVLAVLVVTAFWLFRPEPEAPSPPAPLDPIKVTPSESPLAPRADLSADLERSPLGPTTAPEPDRAPATVVGRVVDSERRPVRAARLELRRGVIRGIPAEDLAQPELGRRVAVAADGTFEIDAVDAIDDLLLLATSDATPPTIFGPFRLEPGATFDCGDLVVDEGVVYRGSVRAYAGRPIEGARVALYQGAPAKTIAAPKRDPQWAVLTDDEGRFEIGPAQLGQAVLEATADGFGTTSVGVFATEDPASRTDVSIVMREAIRFGGTVVAADDGAPIADARVVAQPYGTILAARLVTTTDRAGRFEFDAAYPGNFAVWAEADGFIKDSERYFAVNPRDLRIALQRRGAVRARVVGDDGEPVEHFDVSVMFHRRRIDEPFELGIVRRFHEPDGEFEIRDLEPGFYAFEVWANGYALTRSESVRVTAGQTSTGPAIALERPASLAGTVVNDLGAAIEGATVTLFPNNETTVDFFRSMDSGRTIRVSPAETDERGSFVLSDVPSGTYQIEVRHRDHAAHFRNDVVVEPATRNEIGALRLARAATVRGAALSMRGNPVAGAEVSIGGNGIVRQTRAGADGRFSFGQLAPGEYTLNAYGANVGLIGMIQSATSSEPTRVRVEAGQEISQNVYVVQ